MALRLFHLRAFGSGGFRMLVLTVWLLPLTTACKTTPHRVDLAWKAPVTSPVPVTGYNIYRSADGGATYHRLNASPVKETKFVDRLIQPGRTYRYTVRSVDAQGVESIPTATVDVTLPQ